MYYKRALLMVMDPMVSSLSNVIIQFRPLLIVAILYLSLLFYAWQYFVLTFTASACASNAVGDYCRETFAPIISWFVIGTITIDYCSLMCFISRWGEFLSMFAEENSDIILNQFLLVVLALSSSLMIP